MDLLIKRLLGRPTLRVGRNTSIGRSAKVLNAGATSDNIRVGKNCRIEGELFVFAHGGKIRLGDWCFIGPGSRLWAASEIWLGDRVLISHNCNIMDSLTHPIDARERHEQFRSILVAGHPIAIDLAERPVRIEDDAWVGAGVTILRGVTIGSASIVGAGSVVTHDVPKFTVVAGNPAKIVRILPYPGDKK